VPWLALAVDGATSGKGDVFEVFTGEERGEDGAGVPCGQRAVTKLAPASFLMKSQRWLGWVLSRDDKGARGSVSRKESVSILVRF
jgi:hypothetical protein